LHASKYCTITTSAAAAAAATHSLYYDTANKSVTEKHESFKTMTS